MNAQIETDYWAVHPYALADGDSGYILGPIDRPLATRLSLDDLLELYRATGVVLASAISAEEICSMHDDIEQSRPPACSDEDVQRAIDAMVIDVVPPVEPHSELRGHVAHIMRHALRSGFREGQAWHAGLPNGLYCSARYDGGKVHASVRRL